MYLAYVFLSTLSLRRATSTAQTLPLLILFLSTLSLRRATPSKVPARALWHHFYPRSPCGERRTSGSILDALSIFLSTLSLRRATRIAATVWGEFDISIHALLAESDPPVLATSPAPSKFLSTLSLRRATIPFITSMASVLFLSTLSLRRATYVSYNQYNNTNISIHALLAESDSVQSSVC